MCHCSIIERQDIDTTVTYFSNLTNHNNTVGTIEQDQPVPPQPPVEPQLWYTGCTIIHPGVNNFVVPKETNSYPYKQIQRELSLISSLSLACVDTIPHTFPDIS